MSDINKNQLKEMFEKADESNEYTLLNKHLQEIRDKLKDKVNPPSSEQILSAYNFAKLLKLRLEAKKISKKNIEDLTQVELGNLSDEFNIYKQIKSELGDFIGLERKIRFKDNDVYLNDDSQGSSSIVPVNFYITKNGEDDYTVRAVCIKSNGEKIIDAKENIRDLNEIESFRDRVASGQISGEIKENLSGEKQKGNTEVVISSEKQEKSKTDEKTKKKTSRGESKFEKKDTPYDKSEIKVDVDEIQAVSEITGFKHEKVNYVSLMGILKAAYINSAIIKVPENEDALRKLGYEPYKNFISFGMIYDDEFEAAKMFIEKAKAKDENILKLLPYYLVGENALIAKKDIEVLKKYKKNESLEYLADTNGRFETLTSAQLQGMFHDYGDKKSLSAVTKMVNSLGGAQMSLPSSREELYDMIVKNPSIKRGFLTAVNKLGSRTEEFIKCDGDLSNYYSRLQRGSEQLSMKLDKLFEEKFKNMPKQIKLAKEKIMNDKNLTNEQKQLQYTNLDLIEHAPASEKFNMKNLFKIKSIALFGSLIDKNEGGGGAINIGINSENEFLKELNFQVGFFTTAKGETMPGVGLSIGKKIDMREDTKVESEFLRNMQFHGDLGVTLFGVYIVGGANYQFNYDDLKKNSFTGFDNTSKRFGVYGNIGMNWATAFTYGAGLYYKESASEGIKQKEKMLEKTLALFKGKDISEFDKITIPDVSEIESVMIKNELIADLKALGYDKKENEKIKRTIFDAVSLNKRNQFMETATRIAQEKGWEFAGIALGVQFVAGFFPMPVIGLTLERTKQKGEENVQEKFQRAILTWSEADTVKDEKGYKEIMARLSNEFGLIGKYENGYFEFTGYDDATGCLTLSNGDPVAIKYPANKSSEIKINGNKIIVGKLSSFNMGQIRNRVTGKMNRTFIIGNGGDDLETGSAAKFSKNNPTSLIEHESTHEKSGPIKIEMNRKGEMYDEYLEKNRGEFNKTMYIGGNWHNYIMFKTYLDNMNYKKSADFLLKFLNLFGRSRDNKMKEQHKLVVNHLNNLKINNDENLPKMLADFKDILMADRYTKSRFYTDEAELLSDTDSNTNILNKRGISDKLKSAASISEVNLIIKKMNRAEFAAFKKTNYYLLTQNIDGDKTLNRKAGFNATLNRFMKDNGSSIMNARQEVENHYKNNLQAGWSKTTRNDIFALVATYKITKDSKGKTISTSYDNETKHNYSAKGFDAMPPGTTSVADNKIFEFVPDNKKSLLDKFAEKKEYFDIVKKSILKHVKGSKIGSQIDEKLFTDEKLKELILSGKKDSKIDIGGVKIGLDSAFVFFMYGQCFNESVGLKFGEIELELDGKIEKFSPVALGESSYTPSHVATPDAQSINLGLVIGEKKPESKLPSSPTSSTTTPPTTTIPTTVTTPPPPPPTSPTTTIPGED